MQKSTLHFAASALALVFGIALAPGRAGVNATFQAKVTAPKICSAAGLAGFKLDGVRARSITATPAGSLTLPGAPMLTNLPAFCRDGDADNCLTAPQLAALQKMYAGPRNPRTGEQIYPGWPKSSEALTGAGNGPPVFGWNSYWGTIEPARANFWRHWVFNDPQWNWWSFDFDRDLARAEMKIGSLGSPSPINDAEHDLLAALDSWVEKGVAPEKIIASKVINGVAVRNRPLCPYPRRAVYKGSGSTDDAANFTCRADSSRAQAPRRTSRSSSAAH